MPTKSQGLTFLPAVSHSSFQFQLHSHSLLLSCSCFLISLGTQSLIFDYHPLANLKYELDVEWRLYRVVGEGEEKDQQLLADN